ncbi:MAG: 1-acyl-sn-glycerol-3-phosphate acyltransferase [Saprospiraceae bacterium]
MVKRVRSQEHIIPDIEEWPIFKLSQDREKFVEEINAFTFQKITGRHNEVGDYLARSIYQELIRIKEEPWRVDPPNEKIFWKRQQEKLSREDKDFSDAEYKVIEEEVLRAIINRYSEEIVGTFSISTFLFARKVLTSFFKRLLTKVTSRGIFRFWGQKKALYEKLKVYGPLDDIRELTKDHVIVILPTHFSNLDSVLIGYAIDQIAGLPSFSYGAGLNLYNSGLAAYFMNRLGAYRVDRRKKSPVYLETLKSMSTLSLLRGTNSLFFPGGTRSRSGALEDRLKLGLLNTLIESQRNFCGENSDKKIIVVPLVLSYNFVLEGKYLIENYLRRTGKEKYIRSRDNSKSYRQVTKFASQFFFESSEITLSFGAPFDVMGNAVTTDGKSIDHRGHEVEIKDYFLLNGKINEDPQREAEYTKLLAEKVVAQFHKESIALASHIVAFAAFVVLQNSYKNLDLFGVLQLPEEEVKFPLADFVQVIADLRAGLSILEANGEILLPDDMREDNTAFVQEGVTKLGTFHDKRALYLLKDGDLASEDFKLLFYYHNRLEHYDLAKYIKPEHMRLVAQEPPIH